MLQRLAYTFLLLAAITASGCAREAAETDPCVLPANPDGASRILFIGNSYTYYNDLPEILEGIAAANGKSVETGLIAAGGLTLADHAASDETASTIRDGSWDVVFLQEQSSFGDTFLVDGKFRVRPSTGWRAGAEALARIAREAGAMPILLSHWAPEAFPEDQATIDRNIVEGAAAVDACFLRVAPARAIAERALGRHGFYDVDGAHPSPLASYLAAAVIARAISGNDLTEAPLSVSGEVIDTEDGVRTGVTGTLFTSTANETEVVREAVNRAAPEAVAPPPAAPVEISLPALPEAAGAPTAQTLHGAWEGELTLYPIPATIRLEFAEEKGSLVAAVRVRGGSNERKVDGTDVVLEGREARFAFPQGPNGTTIDFVGVLDGEGKLVGTAHFRSDSGDLEGHGSWWARRLASSPRM